MDVQKVFHVIVGVCFTSSIWIAILYEALLGLYYFKLYICYAFGLI